MPLDIGYNSIKWNASRMMEPLEIVRMYSGLKYCTLNDRRVMNAIFTIEHNTMIVRLFPTPPDKCMQSRCIQRGNLNQPQSPQLEHSIATHSDGQ